MIKIDIMGANRAEIEAQMRDFLGLDKAPAASAPATTGNVKPVKATKPAETAPQPTPESKPSSQKADESPAAGDDEPAIDYDTLRKAIMELVAISTEEMKKIADSFGVATFKGTAADVWPKAHAAVVAKIAALKANESMA